MKRLFLSVVIAIACISCSVNEVSKSNETLTVESIETLSLSSDFWASVHEDSKVCENLGKYEEYMVPTDYFTVVSSSKRTPLDSENLYVHHSGRSGDMLTKSNEVPEIVVRIDGKDISDYEQSTKSGNTRDEIASLYGREVSFSIGSLTKSGESDSNVELYVPELINITAPAVTSEDGMFPLCYYDGFLLKWNADQQNKNGVVVVVEWFGTMVFGADNPDAYVRHITLVPDVGEAVLDSDLFDGIPDTALCHLMVIRGDLENVIIDDASHKIIGETHASLPFVLVREIL